MPDDKWDQYAAEPATDDKWAKYAAPPPQQTPAEAGFFNTLGQGLIGAGKSALRTVYNSGAVQGPPYLQGSGLNINTAPAPEAVQPTNTAQKVGGYAETGAELVAPFLGAGKAAVAANEALPSFGKGSALFEELKNSIGSIPVDTSAVMPIAKDAAGMMGHTPPKAVTDYLKVMTPKNVEMPFGTSGAGPAQIPADLTYNQARDLYSAVTKLTVKEAQESSGPMLNKVREFASALDDSIRSAIPSMSDAQKYAAAMEEYAKAGTLDRQIDALKKYGIPVAAGALGVEGLRRLLNASGHILGQ